MSCEQRIICFNINAMFWLILLSLLFTVVCKVYDRCELAQELKQQHNVTKVDDLSTWICITKYESRFDTTATNYHTGDHGIFQISELFWCGRGKACGLSCDKLKDDDLSDDFKCVKKIFKEHQRLQGNGFKAWVVYDIYCNNGRSSTYLDGCDIS